MRLDEASNFCNSFENVSFVTSCLFKIDVACLTLPVYSLVQQNTQHKKQKLTVLDKFKSFANVISIMHVLIRTSRAFISHSGCCCSRTK